MNAAQLQLTQRTRASGATAAQRWPRAVAAALRAVVPHQGLRCGAAPVLGQRRCRGAAAATHAAAPLLKPAAAVRSRAGARRGAHRRAATAATADDDDDEYSASHAVVLTHAQAFGAAAVAARLALPGFDAPLLRLSASTARALTPDADAESDDADAAAMSLATSALSYALDETLAQAAAALGLHTGGGGDSEEEEEDLDGDTAAAAFAAFLEAQWASALAAHAAHAPGAALAVAGVATTLAPAALMALCAERRASADTFPQALAAVLAAAAAAGAAFVWPPPPRADEESIAANCERAMWLCILEALLDVAEAIESDETAFPSAAIILCGDLAEDAPLLAALHALLPGAPPGGKDKAGALALAPVLECACDRGDVGAARALALLALQRLAANRWRSGVRFVPAEALRGDDDVAAAARREGVLRESLLIVVLPYEQVTVSLNTPSTLEGGAAAADVALALSLAAARRARGAQAPLVVALGAPQVVSLVDPPTPKPVVVCGDFLGGAELRGERERLAHAACEALRGAA
jgi:hypothetical protein